MADNVIPIRPSSHAWSGDLLSLPECPPHLLRCGWCEKHIDEVGGWVTQDMGCASCAPKNEMPMLKLAGAQSRVSYLEDQHRRLLEGARAAMKGRGLSALREAVDLWDYNERQAFAMPPTSTPDGSKAE